VLNYLIYLFIIKIVIASSLEYQEILIDGSRSQLQVQS